jgi:hypothetical protein
MFQRQAATKGRARRRQQGLLLDPMPIGAAVCLVSASLLLLEEERGAGWEMMWNDTNNDTIVLTFEI